MPYTPEAYAYTPVNYVGKSGSIPALLLYERDGLSYLRFQTKSWPHYDGWGLWSTVGIFSEHVVSADPHEPAVANLLQELERERAAREQYRQRANGQRASAKAPAPKTSAKVSESSGVKSPLEPAKTPDSKREPSKGKLNGKEGYNVVNFPTRSPARVRQIGGLCLRDFLGNR